MPPYASRNQFLSDKKVLLGQNRNGPEGTTDMVWRLPERRGRVSCCEDEGGGGVSGRAKRRGREMMTVMRRGQEGKGWEESEGWTWKEKERGRVMKRGHAHE